MLVCGTVASYTAVVLAVWGVPRLSAALPLLVIVAGGVSLVVPRVFWNRRFGLGVLIDLGLIVVAVIRPGWTDKI